MRRWQLLILAVLFCCGVGSPSGTSEGENLFVDPGFEDGGEAWSRMRASASSLGAKFTDQVGFESAHSALLELDSARSAVAGRYRAASIAQAVDPPTSFPMLLRGRLRVEHWERPDDEMGLALKAIVGVWRDPRTPEILAARFPGSTAPARPFELYGIHYQLAGRAPASASQPAAGPTPVQNVEEIEIGSGPPELDTWLTFELPIRGDFERVWGTVPEGYEYLSVILQLVWLDRSPGTTVRAKVYLDDLALLASNGPG